MTAKGYKVKSVSDFPAAMKAAHVFEVSAEEGSFIVRGESQMKIDMQYNSLVSLERDAALYALVREAGLPTPKVFDFDVFNGEKYLIVEKLPGINWKEFVEKNNYSKEAYLQSLEALGHDIAYVQRVHFKEFGNIYGNGLVLPATPRFSERLADIPGRKIAKAKHVLPSDEMDKVQAYFEKGISSVGEGMLEQAQQPVLVMTDLHPMNFLVDENSGKPTGYYDLQFAQAGVQAMEMYNLGLQLFSYFDQDTFKEAERAFFQGLQMNDGSYDYTSPLNKNLETILCAGHTLSSVAFYHGAKDGLRDTWSDKFKKVLFDAIDNNEMDYVAFQDIIREKTKQPKQPMLP